jgi:aspartyl-tRNA(Asn)/glutamyl-tRNA(Gln) amidotransferase subunit C
MTQDTNETTKSAVDGDTVRRIARLARIKVSDQECNTLAAELSTIIGWIDQLNQVDTDAVPPMTGVTQMALPLREDAVTDGNRRDDILRNAPDRADDFFSVPKVVE